MKFIIKLPCFIGVIAFISQTFGGELGISTGINSSFYHSWFSQKSEFQKNDYFNPLEIYFRNNFLVGVRSRMSRTVTDFFKNKSGETNIHFVNWYSVLFMGFEF